MANPKISRFTGTVVETVGAGTKDCGAAITVPSAGLVAITGKLWVVSDNTVIVGRLQGWCVDALFGNQGGSLAAPVPLTGTLWSWKDPDMTAGYAYAWLVSTSTVTLRGTSGTASKGTWYWDYLVTYSQ